MQRSTFDVAMFCKSILYMIDEQTDFPLIDNIFADELQQNETRMKIYCYMTIRWIALDVIGVNTRVIRSRFWRVNALNIRIMRKTDYSFIVKNFSKNKT